jgi:hypothetical protein
MPTRGSDASVIFPVGVSSSFDAVELVFRCGFSIVKHIGYIGLDHATCIYLTKNANERKEHANERIGRLCDFSCGLVNFFRRP